MQRVVLVLVLVAACGGDRSRPPPPQPAEPVATAALGIPGPPTLVGPWRDFDELPPGAIKRLGSQRMSSASAVVAIRDDGTLALFDANGVIEVRTDGKYRIAIPENCQSDGAMHYAGDDLRVSCNKMLYTVHAGVASSVPSPCEYGKSAFSPNGAHLVCASNADKGYEVTLVAWPGKAVWTFPIDKEPGNLFATDNGDVVLVEKEVRLLRAGAVVWTTPLELEWSGLGADQGHVVGWLYEPGVLVRLALEDGKEQSRVRLEDRHIDRDITELPDGASYFAAVNGVYPGGKPDDGETFRARIDAKTGALLATWRGSRGSDTEWGNAVSPNGRWAASVGVQVMRIRLDDPRAPVERTAGEDQAYALAFSPDGSTVAMTTNTSISPTVVVFDVATATKRGVAEAPEFAEGIAFSPDGQRFAVSGQFGHFAIYDARTVAQQCSAEDIQGRALWWYGSRIVGYYPGDNGDDCDEITEGGVSVADDQCKLIKRHEIYGMAELLEATPARTTFAFAHWKNECGAGHDLAADKAFAIDNKTGAKIAVPKLDGEATKRENQREAKKAAVEESDTATPLDVAIAEGNVELSGDGKTRVTWETDESMKKTYLHCTDVATNRTFGRYLLTDDIRDSLAISRDGALVAVADRASLLIYRCRTP